MKALTLKARRYRAAQDKADTAREALYAEIRSEHAQGASYRAIAADTGLSFPRVQQVVNAPPPADPPAGSR